MLPVWHAQPRTAHWVPSLLTESTCPWTCALASWCRGRANTTAASAATSSCRCEGAISRFTSLLTNVFLCRGPEMSHAPCLPPWNYHGRPPNDTETCDAQKSESATRCNCSRRARARRDAIERERADDAEGQSSGKRSSAREEAFLELRERPNTRSLIYS